jgi:hypothetical protein
VDGLPKTNIMKNNLLNILILALAIFTNTSLFAQQFTLRNQVISKSGEEYSLSDEYGTVYRILSDIIVLKYQSGVSTQVKTEIEESLGLVKIRQASTGFIDYQLPEGSDYFNILQKLTEIQAIEVIEVASEGFYTHQPNDPLFPTQWNMQQKNGADINAPEAFDLTMGNNRVIVAVIDSGTDWQHEDLGLGTDGYQNIYLNPGEDAWANPNNPTTGNGIDDDGNGFIDDWKGWDFDNNDNDCRTGNRHGTRVAGIVSAKTNNGKGIAGVAGGNHVQGAQILGLSIGSSVGTNSHLIDDAILYAMSMGVNIIQLSLVTAQSPSIDSAIIAANNQGIIIICASGNSGGPVNYPAIRPEVLAVGATDKNDARWGLSAFGRELDLAAPGVDILSTTLGNSYDTDLGTSFAAPQVSGAAALLLSWNPCLSSAQIKDILKFSADKVGGYDYNWNPNEPGHSLELGYGRLNLYRALTDQPHLDVHIYEKTTFDTKMTFYGNVYVHTGAELIITSKIEFYKGKGIIVERGAKLHVNKGWLSKCSDGDDWRGINVEGIDFAPQPDPFSFPNPDQAGIVLINNGAIIEWAEKAVSTTRYNDESNSEYWGGLVYCENAHFKKNKQVAEFLKYDLPNTSKFINCSMQGGGNGEIAVSIWDTDGITFNLCQINGMNTHGIVTYDAGVVVKDRNDFQNNRRGVAALATFPYSAFLELGDFDILPNQFNNNLVHVETNASGYGPGININNNYFNAAGTAIWITGPSRYFVHDNEIHNAIAGIQTYETGDMEWYQHNYIRRNNINAGIGILASGKNREMQFLCNNFSSAWDFMLMPLPNGGAQGEIRQQQGDPDKGAGNCFSSPVQFADIFTGSQTLPFVYNLFGQEACRTPITPGNYTISSATGDNCDQKLDPNLLLSVKQYDDLRIKAEYVSLRESSANNDDDKLMEKKAHLLNKMITGFMQTGDIESAIQLLDQENTVVAQLMKFGLQMGYGAYDSANTTLESLPDYIDHIDMFKQVQKININRLIQGKAYKMPQKDSLYLEFVSINETGVRSYARSILGLMFGRKFEPDHEEMNGLVKGKSILLNKKENILAYPNPASSELNIVLQGNDLLMARFINTLGQIIYTTTISENQSALSVPVENWGIGSYFLEIIDKNGKMTHAQTITVTR